MANITVILKSGQIITLPEWQKVRGYTDTQIGRYFSYTEPRFAKDLQLYGKLVLNEMLMDLLDRYRELLGEPVYLNSFNRNQEKQDQLHKDGHKAATVSPHVHFMAADCPAMSIPDVHKKVELFRQAAKDLNMAIRIGYRTYYTGKPVSTFVHVDVCPEFFAPGKPYNGQKHPWEWEVVCEW